MKKGLKKPIALLLSAMMIFSTSASAFPAMAEDNLIFGKAENNSIHSDYESEITVTTCENQENPLETETKTVSTTTEVSVQYNEEQTENNPVEVHNSDYAVYAVSSNEYEQPEGDGSESSPYQISNSSQLFWFAKQVNSGNTSINAVLTTNIVVNQNVLNANGTLNTSLTNLIEWTPIGNESNKYTGTFDGQNHTISGLYFDKSTAFVGLFGYNKGTIKNVGIIDSYFKGFNRVGGVCGENNSKIENSYNTGLVSGSGNNVGGICGNNFDTIENSYNTGTVSGSKNVGGICGYNYYYVTIKNSYNTGSVSGSGNNVGGICGDNNGTITNSYNTGSVSGTEQIGGVCGYNSDTIENSYYLENCNANGTKFDCNEGTKQTSEQFENGEVAYRLGGIWGQEIEKDKLPVLNGKKVYENITYTGCCEKYQGNITYNYSNK